MGGELLARTSEEVSLCAFEGTVIPDNDLAIAAGKQEDDRLGRRRRVDQNLEVDAGSGFDLEYFFRRGGSGYEDSETE